MRRFEGKRILVGVTGGIAAYKACDLIRMLYREGAQEVVAVMTEGAEAFISPLTLETLTRHPVYMRNLENTPEGIPTHIALAQRMDALIILPASANTLAKVSHGLADDLLTTTALAFSEKPTILAPAMNLRMWKNPIVQKNLRLLKNIEWILTVPPQEGELACGEYGEGKLASLEIALLYLYKVMHPQRKLYKDKRVVVTAGGTVEPLDAVRVLTNRSSGKMGLAIADELFAMGADVLLLHTMPDIDRPYRLIQTETAEEMALYAKRNFKEADGIVMAAAVGDFQMPEEAKGSLPAKIKKTDHLTLSLVKTPDILAEIGPGKKPSQFVVGFAAEADHVLLHAREKLERKQLDMIVVNDISRNDIGFGSDENEVTLLFKDKERVDIPKTSKQIVARQMLLYLYQKFLAKREGDAESDAENVAEGKTSDSSD